MVKTRAARCTPVSYTHLAVYKRQLLILDDREYRIKLKDAEAALLDAQASKDILSSGIETSQVNISVQEANIAETEARLRQLKQDHRRYANLLAEESVSQQQYEQVKAEYEAMKARYESLLRQKSAAQSQYSETSKKSGSVKAVSYTHLDVYKRQSYVRTIAPDVE